jgi:hypothetical protein
VTSWSLSASGSALLCPTVHRRYRDYNVKTRYVASKSSPVDITLEAWASRLPIVRVVPQDNPTMPRRITTPSEGGGRKRGDCRCAWSSRRLIFGLDQLLLDFVLASCTQQLRSITRNNNNIMTDPRSTAGQRLTQIKDFLTMNKTATTIPWDPDCTKFPTRKELPQIPGAPPEAAWVWGDNDYVCIIL